MINISDFQPDWKATLTAEDSEIELNGFKFKGPGWYIEKDDTVLVFPANGECEEPWKQTWEEDRLFHFLVYNERNPSDAFNAIVNAPVKLDQRT